MMPEKILMVDDEPALLEGYQRILRGDFHIETAIGPQHALAAISANAPYAVIVSDMQMPGMNGIEFLSRVKTISPDTVRVMLTGQRAIQTAMDAINENHIFRFLTKPCQKETLASALTAALKQFRLVMTEKELLDNTLKATIAALTEVLSLVNPAAFSRAQRLQRYVSHVVSSLKLRHPWRFEVAAMMSQMGCVTLDPHTIDALYAGAPLTPDEQASYDAHPAIGQELLKNIPRMEPIAWMIAHQNRPAPVEDDIANRDKAETRLGAEILHAALEFDEWLRKGKSRTEAGTLVARRNRHLDQKVFLALVELEPEKQDVAVRTCTLEELSPGMILDEDVRTGHGLLIAAQAQEVTPFLMQRLKNFHAKNAIQGTVRVSLPGPPHATGSAPQSAAGAEG
jgi:CheY-like chemotaxis protein